jgi:hypothetical protein
MMKRLSDTAYELNKPEPTPWDVSGEIKAITADSVTVTVMHSGEEKEWTMPRQEFPVENFQTGQHFFAAIKPEQPRQLLDIELLPVREEKSFDDLFISLFGREAYEVVSARWSEEEEEKPS